MLFFFFLPFFFFFFLGNGLVINPLPGFGYFLSPGLYSISSGIKTALYNVTILYGQWSLANLSLIVSNSFIYSSLYPSVPLLVIKFNPGGTLKSGSLLSDWASPSSGTAGSFSKPASQLF